MLTEREAADRLGLAPGTLANWRVQGRGPAWVEIGHRCIRYEDEAIDRYIADRVIDPLREVANQPQPKPSLERRAIK